jgi:hypothetical protein
VGVASARRFPQGEPRTCVDRLEPRRPLGTQQLAPTRRTAIVAGNPRLDAMHSASQQQLEDLRARMYRDRQQAIDLRKLARIQRRDAANQRAYAADVRRSNVDRRRSSRPTDSASNGRRARIGSAGAGPDTPSVSPRHEETSRRPAGNGLAQVTPWPTFVVSPPSGHYSRRASEARQRAQDAGDRARLADVIARHAHERAVVAVRRSTPTGTALPYFVLSLRRSP